LKIVTAISSPYLEQRFVSFLCNQGFTLAFRALSVSALSEYLAKVDKPQTIIYSLEFEKDSEIFQQIKVESNHRIVKVDSHSDPIKILNEISNTDFITTNFEVKRYRNLIALFGSPGSPGVSTIANFLSIQLPATIICSTTQNLRPELTSQVLRISPDNLLHILKTNIQTKCIIDSGPTISLTRNSVDRRANARWEREIVASCSKIIYIIKADLNGLKYLERFIGDFVNVINPPQIIYVLNQQRFNKQGQRVQQDFKSMVQGSTSFVLPFSLHLLNSYSIQSTKRPLWHGNSFQKQIAKMSAQLL
jgi:hypothetical protein